ncbi:hypothetical protein [Pedobacter sp. GR22-6]|uniref:hypothetical protein n=1 Tax=Pedobacter sp. GR22-6 TaxID=3127957 RepID=UPI00307ED98A
MKNYIYTTCCLLLLACGQSQNSTVQNPVQKDSVSVVTESVESHSNPSSVSEIKNAYAAINDKLQRKRLDSVSFKYDCEGERTGTVTYFSEQGRLALIKHSFNEYSHFSAVDQYFVRQDSLFSFTPIA